MIIQTGFKTPEERQAEEEKEFITMWRKLTPQQKIIMKRLMIRLINKQAAPPTEANIYNL